MPVERHSIPLVYLSKNRSCLVVGAGKVASRKIKKLLHASFQITIIAPEIHKKISAIDSIKILKRKFKKSDLEGMDLVIAATDDAKLNLKIIKLCQQGNILVSAVDQHWPEGDFISPATFMHGDFSIAISSSGKDYRATKSFCKELEQHLNNKPESKLLLAQCDLTVLGKSDNKLNSKAKVLSQIKGIDEFILLGAPTSPSFVGLVDPSANLFEVLDICLFESSFSENVPWFSEHVAHGEPTRAVL